MKKGEIVGHEKKTRMEECCLVDNIAQPRGAS